MADLFMDFKGINVTLAVAAQAVIAGRVDCKTAGRLVVQLQTFSKLLWQIHRKGREGRKENRVSPQIYADERRLGKEEALTTKDTKEHEGLPQVRADERRLGNGAAYDREETRIALVAKGLAIADGRSWAHAPPELLRAA